MRYDTVEEANMADQAIGVLLVAADFSEARRIEFSLAEGQARLFEVYHMGRLTTALERLSTGGIDVVLLDPNLPDSRELDAFFRIYCAAAEVPILVLMGCEDATVEIELLRAGAQECLLISGLQSHNLRRAILHSIERKRAETAFRRNLLMQQRAGTGAPTPEAKGRNGPLQLALLGWSKARRLLVRTLSMCEARGLVQLIRRSALFREAEKQQQLYENCTAGSICSSRLKSKTIPTG